MIKGDKMTKYEALLVAPDGEFVTDFKRDTVKQVQKELEEIGSKWIFYPYEFIIRTTKTYDKKEFMKQKIIDATEPLDFMKGWTVSRVIKKIATENAKLKEGELWGLYD